MAGQAGAIPHYPLDRPARHPVALLADKDMGDPGKGRPFLQVVLQGVPGGSVERNGSFLAPLTGTYPHSTRARAQLQVLHLETGYLRHEQAGPAQRSGVGCSGFAPSSMMSLPAWTNSPSRALSMSALFELDSQPEERLSLHVQAAYHSPAWSWWSVPCVAAHLCYGAGACGTQPELSG